ncbi:MAG: redoxin domain-containing protein [Hydrogenibacillus schlegelii]|uniref:Redoxin domain-containing protein n=1 Tax=Hydrogenibacillus schlegelii TaxID=1484 RepID=A0A947CYC8_HYDSH|nr:redoxin domain-containing protein [Hydrogenibacillus schlegelii]
MTQPDQVARPGDTVAAAFLPRIGEKVPYFEAMTTHGKRTLDDDRGKWRILFSHPADFTPVCTTEFVAFPTIDPELKKRGAELLGLSIDSLYAHIAWVPDGWPTPWPGAGGRGSRSDVANRYRLPRFEAGRCGPGALA